MAQRKCIMRLNIFTTDSLGKWSRKYDRSSGRTTLINDKVRVYKGGSWR
jgi:hypothetical protein